jgi:hypothetical protein
MIAHFGDDEVLKASQRRLTFTAFDREMFFKTQIARREWLAYARGSFGAAKKRDR